MPTRNRYFKEASRKFRKIEHIKRQTRPSWWMERIQEKSCLFTERVARFSQCSGQQGIRARATVWDGAEKVWPTAQRGGLQNALCADSDLWKSVWIFYHIKVQLPSLPTLLFSWLDYSKQESLSLTMPGSFIFFNPFYFQHLSFSNKLLLFFFYSIF